MSVLSRLGAGSIRRRLVFGIALVHAVLMSLFIIDLVERQRQFLHQEQLARSQSMVRNIGRNSTPWVLSNDVVGLQELIHEFANYPSLRYAMVLDPDGRILAHTDDRHLGQFLNDPLSLGLLKSLPQPTVLVDQRQIIDVAAPVMSSGELIGWARIGVAEEPEGLAVVTRKGVIYAVLAVLTGIFFALVMARGLTRQLYGLLGVADKVRAGDRDIRARTKGMPSELRLLATSFNRMLDTLCESEKELQQSRARLLELNEELERRVEARTVALLEANEEVRNFAYIVSHDLRAPLVNVQGFCGELRYSLDSLKQLMNGSDIALPQSLWARISEIADQDMVEALEFIEGATRKMDFQINAILKLSRMGRQSLRPGPVDLGDVVQTHIAASQHQIQALQGDVAVDDLPSITADRVSIDQIIGNLISNALKYIVPGRSLRIRIWADTDAEGMTLHIADNGRGMRAEDIPRAFELFRRIGKQDTQGEGMGLPYVQALVRRHNGRIWCDSVLDIGTTFHVFIPKELDLEGHHEQTGSLDDFAG